MALVPCPECATQVSDKAAACPKCGHPLGSPAQPVPPAISAEKQPSKAGGPVRDADGPSVSARKVGDMMPHGGNLRVRKGRLQLKGMLNEKDLGEVRNLQAVTVTKSLLSARTEVVFGGADEGKWVIQAAPLPFFRGLEDQLGRKFMTAPEGSNNPQGCAVGCLAVFVVWLISIAFFGDSTKSSSGSTAPVREADSSAAIVMCQGFVTEQLKSPKSADFPWMDRPSVVQQGASFEVRSYVDSQNSFGATLRNNYVCRITHKGGEPVDSRNWNLDGLTFSQ